tara:strand:+ start:2556 stop:2777 length:222 start_codon:yes stop_codon:yes gene_type:complete
MKQERRIAPQPTEQELYKKDLSRAIKRERREDQLEKLNEIQQQKKVWKRTFIFCLLLNLTLLAMGLMGTFYNG